MTSAQAMSPSTPKMILPEKKAQAAKPSDNVVNMVTKMR